MPERPIEGRRFRSFPPAVVCSFIKGRKISNIKWEFGSVRYRVKENEEAKDKDKESPRDWKENFSANIHKLIVTIARQRRANVHKENPDDRSFKRQDER